LASSDALLLRNRKKPLTPAASKTTPIKAATIGTVLERAGAAVAGIE
jgi:hypothetical protein